MTHTRCYGSLFVGEQHVFRSKLIQSCTFVNCDAHLHCNNGVCRVSPASQSHDCQQYKMVERMRIMCGDESRLRILFRSPQELANSDNHQALRLRQSLAHVHGLRIVMALRKIFYLPWSQLQRCNHCDMQCKRERKSIVYVLISDLQFYSKKSSICT